MATARSGLANDVRATAGWRARIGGNSAGERAREGAGEAGGARLGVHANDAHETNLPQARDEVVNLADHALRCQGDADHLEPAGQRGERVAVGLLRRVAEDRV